MSAVKTQPKTLALALQGGGAHGAFTWGVLDRLLDEQTAGKLKITAITGTSAGAMNAAVMADGLAEGGAPAAKVKLHQFWKAMSRFSAYNPYNTHIHMPFIGKYSPLAHMFDVLFQFVSPYQLNPLNVNPLSDVLDDTIDFDRLRHCKEVQLYISATNVRTNKLRIFTMGELTREVLLASACLPHIHQAVEVDGEFYWDGGFMGNPVLEPLIEDSGSRDVMIVQINPTQRDTVPRTAMDILDRMNEITFNASLMREMRMLSQQDKIPTHLHLIDTGGMVKNHGVHSKYNTNWNTLSKLHEAGVRQADTWLKQNYNQLGQASTLNLMEWKPTYRDRACKLT